MFYDQVTITVTSGKGGDGVVSFRREAYVPRGGPDGGDGGRGGDVILIADSDLNTLLPFRYKKTFAAGNGGDGAGQKRHGKAGAHLYVKVPPGTVVRDADANVVLADLVNVGDQAVVAEGGRGGLGNVHFVTATYQAPRFADKGEKPEQRTLTLELKLVADVGVIGLPNVGKSSLLASASAARPKIADYPFTTIVPNLGVVSVGDDSFVMVDIPGLIEGAHEGKGLGQAFLRHAERTRLLVHMVDGLSPDPEADLDTVNQEMDLYAAGLKDKPQIIVVNKMDLTEVRETWPVLRKKLAKRGYPVMAISAASGQGVNELMQAVNRQLATLAVPVAEPQEGVKIFRPQAADHFTVSKEGAVFVVRGRRAERIVETADLENLYARQRVLVLLRRLGVAKALLAAGAKTGDRVRFGDSEIEWAEDTDLPVGGEWQE